MPKNKTEIEHDGKSKNGGVMARIGKKFHAEMEDIKKERVKKGHTVDKTGVSKITNLITRHTLWNNIKEDLINASEEEVYTYG